MIDWGFIGGFGGDSLIAFSNHTLLSTQNFKFFNVLFLGILRLIPIAATAPFLGAKVLPPPVKVLLSLCLFIIFFPAMTSTLSTELEFDFKLLLYGGKEFIIGLILGFFSAIPFNIVQSAGFLIDHQRGAASMMVNDPSMQNQSSPIGLFFNLILIYIFYLIEGPFYFFEVVTTSYAIIPIDQFFAPSFFQPESPFWKGLMPVLNEFMTLSVRLAAPSLIILLMTDFFLGIANRLAPQVQIIFLGLGLKSAMPFIVLSLGWYLFVNEIAEQSMKELYHLKTRVYEIGGQLSPPRQETPP